MSGWFILSGVLFLCILIILFLIDWLLRIKMKNEKLVVSYEGSKRCFHICEYNLNRRGVITTDKNYWLYENVKGTAMENREVPFDIDANGFIEPTIYHANSRMKLIFMGDSTTEAAIVMPEYRFASLVGTILNEKGIICSSYNGGYSGADVFRINQAIVCKCLRLRPSHIMLCSCMNDVKSLINYSDFSTGLSENGEIKEENASGEKIYNRIKMGIRCFWPNIYLQLYNIKNKRNEKPCNKVEENIRIKEFVKKRLDNYARAGYNTFISICKDNGINPVLMTQPNLFIKGECSEKMKEIYRHFDFSESLGYEDFVELFQHCSDIIRAVAREKNVVCVDLDKEIPKSDEMIYDYVHLTDTGSKMVASLIVDRLEGESNEN